MSAEPRPGSSTPDADDGHTINVGPVTVADPGSGTPADDDVCPRCNGRGREMNAEVQIGAPSCLACFGTGKKENPIVLSNECSDPDPNGGAPCCRPLGHHVLTDHWNGQDEWPAQPVPSSGGRDQHTCEHGSTYADRDEPMHVEPTAPSSDTPGDECDVIPSAVGRCGRGTPSCVADHPAPSTPVPEASGQSHDGQNQRLRALAVEAVIQEWLAEDISPCRYGAVEYDAECPWHMGEVDWPELARNIAAKLGASPAPSSSPPGDRVLDELRADLAVTQAALRQACHDGWADGDAAMASYIAAAAADREEPT